MKSKKYPYWGICDAKGCQNENCNGGNCWCETGYWCVCREHSQMYRDGKPQPEMKKRALLREQSRDERGYITN